MTRVNLPGTLFLQREQTGQSPRLETKITYNQRPKLAGPQKKPRQRRDNEDVALLHIQNQIRTQKISDAKTNTDKHPVARAPRVFSTRPQPQLLQEEVIR
jgi:hypothetical protein